MTTVPVGDGIAKRLLRVGISPKPGCSCKQYQAHLNRRGPAWTRSNIDTVCGWLMDEAKKRSLPAPKFLVKKLIMSAVKEAEKVELYEMFDEVYCINLDRRQDRWKQFLEDLPSDWPFRAIERFPAIDGKKVPAPKWWRAGAGAWGCYRSHLAIMEDCINRGVKSILLLEDDCQFIDNFTEAMKKFAANLPSDWGMLYLGGQHLHANRQAPTPINDEVFLPYNVNRTHAFGIRGEYLKYVYQHCMETKTWHGNNHIDHHLGHIHMKRDGRVVCPRDWLAGQRQNKSDISGKEHAERLWQPAFEVSPVSLDAEPFVAIVGLHSSGSSCIAGCLWHTGQVHLGNQLVGFYGDKPGKECGYEAIELHRICQQAVPAWGTDLGIPKNQIWNRLRSWVRDKKREAQKMRKTAGGKHPLLLGIPDQLVNSCGKTLKLVVCDRPIEDSIKSIIKREGKRVDAQKLEAHQRWLAKNKEYLAERVPHVRVDYYELLKDPQPQMEKVCEFLGIELTGERLEAIRNHVDPSKKHVGAEDAVPSDQLV